MVNPIVVGIIGAGRIGRLHADNLRVMPSFKLKSIAEAVVSEELLVWAESRNLGSAFVNGQDILNDPEIEAVFICTPTDTHASWIELAARAGKHIFCEKPISLSSEFTHQALKIVEDEGVLLQVGFNRRMDPSFRKLKQLVQSGELGSPHIVKITSRDPQPPGEAYVRSSGGMFMDMTIHDFDMARYLMGEEVTEVYTRGANLVDPMFGRCDDVDTAVITLTFASGAICVIDNSRKAVYGYDQRVEVFGSCGSATADNCRPTTVEVSTAASVTRDQPLHFFLERYNQAFVEEVAAFARALRLQEPIICSGLDGQQAERIAEAAKESYLTGLPVKLSSCAGEGISATQAL
ncbi:inositol 2-dehydrogenase [Paenibacillus odorifer]|jgi:myo-inositol 2-dehydrogenase/D-chiro-inositol 1-dehydrogenase|uniref:inositol 2-dehydrogenase n=1 Tax=Paenibacillus TaxID=44249 RepID=UPI00096FBBC5|nr:inositol 2-dehydrogenase [Paenibacillus odorifer]OMD92301.1 inositol 2-dehydrogenase [Paenibacillus odorifer]